MKTKLKIDYMLRSVDACSEAVSWSIAYGDDVYKAWKECQRGDWMLWLLGRLSGIPGSDSRKKIVLAACECARLALPQYEMRYPDNKRPRTAIETAENYVKGVATLKEVREAAYSTYASAENAYAAYSAAYLVYGVDATHAAASTADAISSNQQVEYADIVRKHFPLPPRIKYERHNSH